MARRLIVLYHDDFKEHRLDIVDHPENPRRLELALRSIREAASIAPKNRVKFLGATGAGLEPFKRVHESTYVESVMSLLKSHRVEWIDKDTYVSGGSLKAISRLVGASHKAVSLALREVNNLILGRPPSHHAGRRGKAMGAPSMGFCIFNATALIADILNANGKIAIVDFDAHHGNGTQEIFYSNPRFLHVDIHVDPSTAYPGTGYPDEVGEGEAAGTKVNIVVPHMAGDDIYMDALKLLEAILESWHPDYIVVSAGFDAYRGDNDMVYVNAGTRFYYNMGRILSSKAKAVVSVLEGGYGSGLDRALRSYTAGLIGLREYPYDPPSYSNSSAWRLYRLYRMALLTSIAKHKRIDLPGELLKRVLAKTRLGFKKRKVRRRKFRRYI